MTIKRPGKPLDEVDREAPVDRPERDVDPQSPEWWELRNRRRTETLAEKDYGTNGSSKIELTVTTSGAQDLLALLWQLELAATPWAGDVITEIEAMLKRDGITVPSVPPAHIYLTPVESSTVVIDRGPSHSPIVSPPIIGEEP